MNCYRCGGELSTGDNDGVCSRCRNLASIHITEHSNGWICPKCGSVYSPWTPVCYACNGSKRGKD